MRFLKALFWIFVGVAVALFIFANRNEEVTVNLWRDVAWIMKLPTLVFLVFLLSFLPTFLIGRAQLWKLRRRYEGQAPANVANVPPAAPLAATPAERAAALEADRPPA